MKRAKKLRGISLLTAVYDELSQQVPENSVGTEELLGAAQTLIDLSKKEYMPNAHFDERRYHGYYSCDVYTAFDKYQGRILENEMATMMGFSTGCSGRNAFEELLKSSRQDMILEEVYG